VLTVAERATRLVRFGVYALAIVGVQVAAGAAATGSTSAALAAVGVAVAIPLALMSPVWIATLALPCVVLSSQRLGSGGVDLSYADAALVGATLLALREAPWDAPVLRRAIWGAGAYMVMLSFTVLWTPTVRGVLEWLHRGELVIGSIVVGSAIGAADKARAALRLYLGASLAIAVGAIVFSLAHGFEPAYPFGVIHKNAGGTFLAAALIISIVAAREVALPRPLVIGMQVMFLVGLLACQARGASVAFMIVLLLVSARRRARGILIPLVGVTALAVMIYSSVQKDSLSDAEAEKFGSVGTRVISYETSLQYWRENPIFGAGMRFFKDPTLMRHLFTIEPHSVVIGALAETGIVGLGALVLLNGAVLVLFRRRRDPLGQAAYYLTIAHVVDSLVGIFWVAGTGTLPWLVVGLAAASTGEVVSSGSLVLPARFESIRSTDEAARRRLQPGI